MLIKSEDFCNGNFDKVVNFCPVYEKDSPSLMKTLETVAQNNRIILVFTKMQPNSRLPFFHAYFDHQKLTVDFK